MTRCWMCAVLCCVAAAFVLGAEEIYEETYRPQFHFTPKSGWMNDPNGLVHFEGEYHLFYQHTPEGAEGKHWGHAISRDLVHWGELPVAFAPENGHEAFSGCALVDWHNTSGFGEDSDPPLIALFTRWGDGQYLAYSNDRGRSWTEYAGNPVLRLPKDGEKRWATSARDPKVFWHEPTQRWVMLQYQNLNRKKGNGIFTSPDLKNWTFQSHVPGLYVCPDLLHLPVDGDSDNRKWVLMDWAVYALGEFDGKAFHPETEFIKLDQGANYSAAQTWSDMPADDPRTIQIAWMRGGKYPGMPFDQQMNFPTTLTLKTFSDGVRLCRYPIDEIEKLHDNTWDLSKQPASLRSEQGAAFDIDLRITPGKAGTVTLGVYDTELQYVIEDQAWKIFDKNVKCPLIDGALDLRMLVDRTSTEIYLNGGYETMTFAFVPEGQQTTITVSSTDDDTRIESGRISTLKSIWADAIQR